MGRQPNATVYRVSMSTSRSLSLIVCLLYFFARLNFPIPNSIQIWWIRSLHVSLGLVEKNLKYLRQHAKENISHYVDEYLPAEFQHCLDALNMIVKEMWL